MHHLEVADRELQLILREIRTITATLGEAEEGDVVRADWRFAAMVGQPL